MEELPEGELPKESLRALFAQIAATGRAIEQALVFAEGVASARDIDKAYGVAFDRARAGGVEALALRCRLTPDAIVVEGPVPIGA